MKVMILNEIATAKRFGSSLLAFSLDVCAAGLKFHRKASALLNGTKTLGVGGTEGVNGFSQWQMGDEQKKS